MFTPREGDQTESVDVYGVDVIRWNPPRPVTRKRVGKWLPKLGMTANFGDMLGPVVAEQVLQDAPRADLRRRLLVVGSILHFAEDGDVVWGAGVNGKVPLKRIRARRLDVRAVRGPLTSAVLHDFKVSVPSVFGDPGLLVPRLLGIQRAANPKIPLLSLPNLRDAALWKKRPGYISPRSDYREIIQDIANSERVVTSSLHGLVIAESLGIPVTLVRSLEERSFKYEDYFEGTGRPLPAIHLGFEQALDSSPLPALQWDASALLAAFPHDLWRAGSEADAIRSDVKQ